MPNFEGSYLGGKKKVDNYTLYVMRYCTVVKECDEKRRSRIGRGKEKRDERHHSPMSMSRPTP